MKVFQARGVITANISNLAAFTVASNDGLTYAKGDLVLLVGQTTAPECGLYHVGTVVTTTAPLTRVVDMAAGMSIVNGSIVEVSEGTLWAGSTWKAMCTGDNEYGTDDPLFYPRCIHRTVTLSSGVLTIGAGGDSVATPVFSTTKTQVAITRNTANTSTATTGGYAAPVGSRVAGKAGTGAIAIVAQAAAGTTNTADVSSLDVTITNW